MKIAWDDEGGMAGKTHTKSHDRKDAITNTHRTHWFTHAGIYYRLNSITVDSLGQGGLIPIDRVTTGSGEWSYATALKAPRSIC